MLNRPTLQEVLKALESLRDISRPDGDNEGDPINGSSVFEHLHDEDQEIVRHAEDLAREYTGASDGEVNSRAVNTLTKNGFRTVLQTSQDDPYRRVGYVNIGDWKLDLSDSQGASEDE